MNYSHLVAGIYLDETAANHARGVLESHDVGSDIVVMGPGDAESFARGTTDTNDVGGSPGATVGAAVGLIVGAGLVMAMPVAAALAGAGLTTLGGAVTGHGLGRLISGDDFREIVSEALKRGHWAVVAFTDSESRAMQAQVAFEKIESTEETVDHGGAVHSLNTSG